MADRPAAGRHNRSPVRLARGRRPYGGDSAAGATRLSGHGDVGNKQDLLDEAKLLGDLQAGIKAAYAKGMSREEMVKNLYFREYKELRNYDRLHGFIEPMYNLVATGKSAFQLP